MQNLRESMVDCKIAASESGRPAQRKHLEHRGLSYLARYFYLITFTAHLHTDTLPATDQEKECAADGAVALTGSFTSWMHQHREVYHLLNNITLN
jgi:hypothetical protein